MDWDKINKQKQIARYGADDWQSLPGMMAPLIRPRRRSPPLSKAALRMAAERAITDWQARQASTVASS
nr:hypothetical protein CIT39_15590 [Bradyrhizobium symbiodeficiens]